MSEATNLTHFQRAAGIPETPRAPLPTFAKLTDIAGRALYVNTRLLEGAEIVPTDGGGSFLQLQKKISPMIAFGNILEVRESPEAVGRALSIPLTTFSSLSITKTYSDDRFRHNANLIDVALVGTDHNGKTRYTLYNSGSTGQIVTYNNPFEDTQNLATIAMVTALKPEARP